MQQVFAEWKREAADSLLKLKRALRRLVFGEMFLLKELSCFLWTFVKSCTRKVELLNWRWDKTTRLKTEALEIPECLVTEKLHHWVPTLGSCPMSDFRSVQIFHHVALDAGPNQDGSNSGWNRACGGWTFTLSAAQRIWSFDWLGHCAGVLSYLCRADGQNT